MEKFYDDVLPCLQSVGPWWTELDRRILFSHLLKIFPFDAEYLSSLPAAEYSELGDTHRLSENMIREDLRSLNKGAEKINCPCIRRLDFSFGKLNPRVCYLCPYSSTYKNSSQPDEQRFLYHIMNHEKRTLSGYLDDAGKTCKDVFKSFFPVYANDILIEAYPFELVAEQFLEIAGGSFISDSDKYHKQVSEGLNRVLADRLKYHRTRVLVEKHIPDYQNLVLLSAGQILFALENQNRQTRSINESLMKRLFALLLKSSKYSAKDPKQYICRDQALAAPKIFDSAVFEDTANFSLEEAPAEPHDTIRTQQPELVNPLACMEDQTFRELPDLDAKNIQLNSMEEPLCDFAATALPLTTSMESVSETSNIVHATSEAQPSSFEAFYTSRETETFYKCGQNNFQYDKAVLDAFLDSTSFLSMEPFNINGQKGLLMCNANIDKLFFPVEWLGPREIRYIANRKLPVYTSNVYQLAAYLFSNKIYKLELHDVGAAVSLLHNKTIRCINDFCRSSLPDCMDIYFDIYNAAFDNLSKDGKTALHRLEQFLPLLCGDGMKPPFASMQQLVSVVNATTYRFLYTSDSHPERAGMFLHLQVKIDNPLKSTFPAQHMYMDACIELSKYVPFYQGNVQVLQIGADGLLLYLLGNRQEIEKNRLYMSASIRRIFSSLLDNNKTVSIEEKSQLYNLN